MTPFSQPPVQRSRPAFTLVELLIVITIMAVLLALAAFAVSSLKRAGEMSRAIAGFTGVMDEARAYAMANDTYVYLGVMEVDAARPEGAVPQTPATGNAGGRVVLAVVASKDGTKGYPNPNAPGALAADNLTALGELRVFEGIHLADFGDTPPASGGMQRPAVSEAVFRLGNAAAASATTFTWPLKGRAVQFTFTRVLQISPQGGVTLPQSGGSQLARWIEVILQEAEGNQVPSVPTNQNLGNHAAIQINGLSGATRIFRPDL